MSFWSNICESQQADRNRPFLSNAQCSMDPSSSCTWPHVVYYTGVPYSLTSILLYQQCSAPDSQVRRVSLQLFTPFLLRSLWICMKSTHTPKDVYGQIEREREKEGSKQNWFKLDDAQSGVNLVSRLDLIRSVFERRARIWETSAYSTGRL